MEHRSRSLATLTTIAFRNPPVGTWNEGCLTRDLDNPWAHGFLVCLCCSHTHLEERDVEPYTAIAAVVGVAILVIVIYSIKRHGETSRTQRGGSPPDVRFTCAKCSGLFPHTKRTVAAWKNGNRRIFCDDCHRKWLSAQPAGAKPARESTPVVSHAQSGTSSRQSARGHSTSRYAGGETRRGCLGATILCVVCPVALLLVVAYA